MLGRFQEYETGEWNADKSILIGLTTFDFFQVETCILTLNTDTLKFIVQLKCRLETVKTHYVSILEQESLQACYVKDQVPNM